MRNGEGVVCGRIGRRWLSVLCAALVTSGVLGACATARKAKAITPATHDTQVAMPPASPLDARKIIQERCTVCHGTFRIKVARVLPIPADRIVDNMRARGAVLNPAERQAVIDYLAY